MAVDNSKYWSWGLPYAGLNNEGSAKYWLWGLPYGFIFEEAAPGGQPYRKRLGGIPYVALNKGVW